MFTAPLIAIVGLVCATTLAIGFGFVVPVSSAVGDFFGSSLKGVGKSEFGGGSAVAQGGSRLA
jgi:hypothetical protein